MRRLNRTVLWLVSGLLVSAMPVLANGYAEPDWEAFRQSQDEILHTLDVPEGPPDSYSGNPVDWFLQRWYERESVEVPETVSDALFIRRASLDVTGLLPTLDDLEGFEDDWSARKRTLLIDGLLQDRQEYAEHWITFWNDLLRNDEQTNIDGLRKPITPWLFQALLENRPYDVMVMELLNPAPGEGPEGFLKGVNWRGRINASQRPVIQAAQNIGQVFMATPLKCASCHDHFTKQWTLKDTYALAASFSEEEELELVRCDSPTGEVTRAGFPLPGLGEIDLNTSLYERRNQAARMVVSPKNPRFAATIVNRLWHRLMGRGLFEPIDDLDYEPIYPELLDWLAHDFMVHGFDIKHTLRRILTSEAYGRIASINRENPFTPDYASPTVRRMQSEQFFDAIFTVSDFSPRPDLMRVAVDSAFVRAWRHRKPGVLATALGRPNREQVVSARDQEATVLQMLELVNGDDFARKLAEAAGSVVRQYPYNHRNDEQLIQRLFRKSLSRAPSASEREMLMNGFTVADSEDSYRSAVEDTLWMLFMHPEFQLIH